MNALPTVHPPCAAAHNAARPAGQRWWAGWSADALRGWGPFLRLSLAALLMIALDWWIYDLLTLLAGGHTAGLLLLLLGCMLAATADARSRRSPRRPAAQP